MVLKRTNTTNVKIIADSIVLIGHFIEVPRIPAISFAHWFELPERSADWVISAHVKLAY